MMNRDKHKSKIKRREGFWHSEQNMFLPEPIPSKNPWHGKKEFLAQLIIRQNIISDLEPGLGAKRFYKGSSNCRICGIINGSAEYEYRKWVWPSGLQHYIEEHNVRPSLAFQEFIMDVYISADHLGCEDFEWSDYYNHL